MFGFGYLAIFKEDACLLNLKKERNGGTVRKREIKLLLSMKNKKWMSMNTPPIKQF